MDPGIHQLQQDSLLNSKVVPITPSKNAVIGNLSQGCPRPVVPASRCYPRFFAPYNLAHPSAASVMKLVSERFMWFIVKRGVHQWSPARFHCRGANVHQQTKASLLRSLTPRRGPTAYNLTSPSLPCHLTATFTHSPT